MTTAPCEAFETSVYSLFKPSSVEEDPIVLRDGSSRLHNYFVTDNIPGKFLQYTTPVGRAGDYLSKNEIGRWDYLQANQPIPIFSERAKDALLAAAPEEVEFYPLKTDVHGVQMQFWLCKAKIYCDIVDEVRSTRRPLAGGGTVLDRIVYRKRFDLPFHIARDRTHPFLVVVSERFVNMCKAKGLRMGLERLPQ